MVDNHGGSDLLGTTDCLEAVGVFKGWKNFLFLIVLLGLLLLQASFYLVDRGYIKIDGQVCADEPAVGVQTDQAKKTAAADSPFVNRLPDEERPAKVEPAKETVVEPDEPAEPVLAVEPSEFVEPNAVAEPNEPAEAVEPNEPAEPNEIARSRPALRPIEARVRATTPQIQYAGQWFPKDFCSKIRFAQLSLLIRIVNAALILAATLYCLTLLFSLKVSLNGRLGGINHISRAFFLSLLMLVLLLPWQRVFGSVVTGAMFTPEELVNGYSAKTDDILDVVLYYLRFSGYGVLMLLLLILSQLRCMRWAKAILRRLEII